MRVQTPSGALVGKVAHIDARGYTPPMAKAPTDRLKIEGSWEDAAKKLLSTPPKSAPPRVTKKRAKKAKGQG